jgi:hypothetical protein
MMWLVFDQLWGATAAVGMKRTFIVNLRLLANLAREPLAGDRKRAVQRIESVRATINTNFANEHALSDAVLFEFGPSREQDLALRDRIRHWQPQLRTLFLIRLALLKYRLRLAALIYPNPSSWHSSSSTKNWPRRSMPWQTGWKVNHRRGKTGSKIRSRVWNRRPRLAVRMSRRRQCNHSSLCPVASKAWSPPWTKRYETAPEAASLYAAPEGWVRPWRRRRRRGCGAGRGSLAGRIATDTK